jgi:hypothetical protein
MTTPIELDARLRAYWEVMPEWARRRYYNNSSTFNILRTWAENNKPVSEIAWGLAQLYAEQLDIIQGLAAKQGLAVSKQVAPNECFAPSTYAEAKEYIKGAHPDLHEAAIATVEALERGGESQLAARIREEYNIPKSKPENAQ